MTKQILLVHGAWHNSGAFEVLSSNLKELGFGVHTLDLPSAKRDGKPLGDLYQDAAAVRQIVEGMGDEVLVLGHSYGGMPITEGLEGASNVSRLIYLTAFMLNVGTSLMDACGEVDPPWWKRDESGDTILATNPEQIFYNTTPPELAELTAASLRPQSVNSFAQKLTKCSWATIPSTYILCRQDQAIPLVAQEAMSAQAGKALFMDTDHSPFLCAPEQLAEIVAAEFI
jgi:pimeloyl-ACP methyl ester carboxylesterase